jgi:hypothetical protein
MTAAIETLEAVARGANPLKGFPIRQRPDSQTIVRVYPHSLKERLLLHGFFTQCGVHHRAQHRCVVNENVDKLVDRLHDAAGRAFRRR